jgi:redox-sensitive bicupin YhaK (pirin superfamily)
VLHSERNDAPDADGPTRFVQMWLRPDEAGLDPSYAQQEVDPTAGLVPLVSGVAGLDAAVRIHTAGAALHVARLAPGASVALPDAPRLHVFVARGSVDLEGAGRLDEGDAARFTGTGGPGVTGATDAEVLVWQLP